jgi:hypothetical protein
MRLILEKEFKSIGKRTQSIHIRKIKNRARKVFKEYYPLTEQCACIYCGCTMEKANGCTQNPNTATIEHVSPEKYGGLYNDLDNMAYACRECNWDKADMSPLEFIYNKAFAS